MSASFSAWHFDGKSAVRRNVEVQLIGQQFFLLEQERRHGPFLLQDLRYVGEQAAASVYRLEEHDGWRLGVSGSVPTEIAAVLPKKQKYGGFIDRVGLGPASVSFGIISAAAIAVALLVPHWLAPLIPFAVEKKIGDTAIGDFGGRFCHTPAGSKALTKLTASLDDKPADLQVEVAKIDIINAAALPGHRVIIFNGMLDQAKSADELAGVLAHEIGHVREHHVMQSLLRQLGLGVVLGGVSGTGGATFSNLMALSYGRDAETEADQHSIKMLRHAGISPAATANFFERMSSMDGSKQLKGSVAIAANYASSHPLSAARKREFLNSVVKGKSYHPALSQQEWTALKTMCAQDRKAKSGFGFDFE